MGSKGVILARATSLLLALLVAAAAACSPGSSGHPGRITVALAAEPSSPRAGQAATVTLRVFATNGPLTIALTSAYPISARGPQGQSLSVLAETVGGGTYTASLVFPAAGRWRISTPTFPDAPGNRLDVVVSSGGG